MRCCGLGAVGILFAALFITLLITVAGGPVVWMIWEVAEVWLRFIAIMGSMCGRIGLLKILSLF